MTKSIAIILPITTLALLSSSCVKGIVLDSKDKPIVAVECILTDETVQTMSLSFARTPSESDAQELKDATVVLTDLTEGCEAGRFIRNHDCIWTLSYRPLYSHRYALDITVPGYDRIHAEDTMVEDFNITYLNWSLISGTKPITPSFANGNSLSVGTYYYIPSLPTNVWIYGFNRDPVTGEEQVVDDICTDFPSVDSFNLSGPMYEGRLDEVVEDEDHGYITTVFPCLAGYPVHNRFLRLPKDMFFMNDDMEYLTISGGFENVYDGDAYRYTGIPIEANPRSIIRFMSVSDVYDEFLRDAVYYQQLKESNNITNIYSHENMFTNIEGGVGVFASAKTQDLPWACLKDRERIYD